MPCSTDTKCLIWKLSKIQTSWSMQYWDACCGGNTYPPQLQACVSQFTRTTHNKQTTERRWIQAQETKLYKSKGMQIKHGRKYSNPNPHRQAIGHSKVVRQVQEKLICIRSLENIWENSDLQFRFPVISRNLKKQKTNLRLRRTENVQDWRLG